MSMAIATIMLPFLLVLCCLRATVYAMFATSGSPCYDVCQAQNSTSAARLVCADDAFSNQDDGQFFKACVQCESESLYVKGNNSDQYWFLFNMKYNLQACLIDRDNTTSGVRKCGIECVHLADTLDTLWVNSKPYHPQYAYCSDNSSSFPTYGPKCAACLQATNNSAILGNFVDTMVNACKTQPYATNSTLIELQRDLFNSTAIPSSSATGTASGTPTSTASTTNGATSDSHGGLSSGATAGIVIACVAAAVSIGTGLFFMTRRKRRSAQVSGLDSNGSPFSYHELGSKPKPAELSSQQVYEAPNQHPPVYEQKRPTTLAELPGQ